MELISYNRNKKLCCFNSSILIYGIYNVYRYLRIVSGQRTVGENIYEYIYRFAECQENRSTTTLVEKLWAWARKDRRHK